MMNTNLIIPEFVTATHEYKLNPKLLIFLHEV